MQIRSHVAARLLAYVLLAAASTGVGANTPEGATAGALPRPPLLEPAIGFWVRVYTEVDADSGFLHDDRHLNVVYERVQLPAGSRRVRSRAVTAAKRRYRTVLATLAGGKRTGLSADEQRVLTLFAGREDALAGASGRLRFQGGLAKRFEAAVVRSGRWLDYIRDAIHDGGLPEELALLPHVESSFTPGARSNVGATGMWQFTRTTGRRFMRIDHVVDERLDPLMATDAAVRLLNHDYAMTGSWPLAITAYNHGVNGMRRAARKLGTDDMGEIAARYRSRTFGFASRNFYAAFLAAVDVDRNAQRYFGVSAREVPAATTIIETDRWHSADALASAVGLSSRELRRLNPALKAPVWSGDKYVPKGFRLRLPAAADTGALAALTGFDAQQPDEFHRIARGESLSVIAAQYGLGLRQLMDLNNITNANRIRAGTMLRLPLAAGAVPAGTVAVAASAAPGPLATLAAPAPAPADPVVPVALVMAVDVSAAAAPAGAPALVADPADYTVADDGRIEIQAEETLGHYAEWLGVRAADLRRINGLRYGQALVVGRRLRLDFAQVDRATFETRRLGFHRDMQEAYFARRRITGTRSHQIAAGDSLWSLAQVRYRLPSWLIRQYNPDVNFTRLSPGTRLSIPKVALAGCTTC